MIIEKNKDIQVRLTNIPKNVGEESTYVFSIPPREQIGIVK